MSDFNINWVNENFTASEIIVFDIGAADISGDAYMFKTFIPNSIVYAFECADAFKPQNLIFAERNDIKYFHCAMSDENGNITYYPSNTYDGNYHPYSGSVCKPTKTILESGTFEWGEPYTVDTIRLDTFCDMHNVSPNIIHIDVQGAEYKVLKNLGKHRPWCIWAEVNEFENCYDTNTKYKDFNELMLSLGYVKFFDGGVDELYVLNTLSLTPYYTKK